MPASLFARRYLFSPKSRSVINLIAVLSVVAVAVPVAAMIVLLSVLNGFEGLIRQNYSLFDAHLTITPREGLTFRPSDLDTAALVRLPEVEAATSILEQHVLLEREGNQATTTLRGVDSAYQRVLPLNDHITHGSEQVQLGDFDRLLLGETMGWQLGIRAWTGEEQVNLYAVRRGSFSSLLPIGNYARRQAEAGGLFRVDYVSETEYALAPLRLAQALFDREGEVSALLIRCTSEKAMYRTQKAVQQLVGEGFKVANRDQLRASFYRLVKYERWGIFFIALLVLIVASFSVIGALSMLIIEKRNERITLRALGATQAFIRSIFQREGYLICAIGAGIGLLLGVAITLLQQHFGLLQLPTNTFLTQSYPVEFRLRDLLLTIGAFAPIARALTTLTVRNMIKNE